MKLLGALLAVCAAAAVIPYKVEIDKENKTFKAKSLTYELSGETDENGEKSINVCFFPEAKRSCDCEDFCEACEDFCEACEDFCEACEDACEACEDACEDFCETCEDIAEDAEEALEEAVQEITED